MAVDRVTVGRLLELHGQLQRIELEIAKDVDWQRATPVGRLDIVIVPRVAHAVGYNGRRERIPPGVWVAGTRVIEPKSA